MQQNITFQPFYNFESDAYDFLDQLLLQVALSPGLKAAEENIRRAFCDMIPLEGDPRGQPVFQYLEQLLKRAMHGLSPSARFAPEPPVDLEQLKAGAFILFCTLCPLHLLNEKLQDFDFLSGLEPFLQAPQSRRKTCEVVFALASKEGYDCRGLLQKTISVLAQYPDLDFAPAAVARAACELILASSENGIDVLRSEAYRTAYMRIKSTLLDQRAPLPSLLPDIFCFFHLSLWAAHNAELEAKAVVAELLPILMAFSRSQIITVRCLAVAALLALEPLDGLYDRVRYMADQRRYPVKHERLAKIVSSVAWDDPNDSPFAAFFASLPTDDNTFAAISAHYRGAETNWCYVALLVADTLRYPRVPRDEPGDGSISYDPMSPDGTQESGLLYIPDIAPTLLAALDDDSDPEAASMVKLLARSARGRLPDLWAQARKTVEQHPTSAYARCVLSLFPSWGEGLNAAKEGLLCLNREIIESNNTPHALRDWLWRRASVQAWEGALRLMGQTLSSRGHVAQLVAAFVASAHHDLESILYARQKEEDIEALRDKSPELLVWYVLLSVALFGTELPRETIDGIERLDIDTEPYGVLDSWLQFTWYDGVTSPQCHEPWMGVVRHVDNLIASADAQDASLGHCAGPALVRDYYKLRDGSFCARCTSPAALLVDVRYCVECKSRLKLGNSEQWPCAM